MEYVTDDKVAGFILGTSMLFFSFQKVRVCCTGSLGAGDIA